MRYQKKKLQQKQTERQQQIVRHFMRYFYAMIVRRLRAFKSAMYAVTYTHHRNCRMHATAAATPAQSLFGHTEKLVAFRFSTLIF